MTTSCSICGEDTISSDITSCESCGAAICKQCAEKTKWRELKQWLQDEMDEASLKDDDDDWDVRQEASALEGSLGYVLRKMEELEQQ